MAEAANEMREADVKIVLVRFNYGLATLVVLASFTCQAATAVECYWCSGVGVDRRCERSPQNITTGPVSIQCSTRYCITTKVINAVTGDVESFARNCDNIPHGNTCIRDTHLVTCFQTCTSDLCNSGNPDPSQLGFSDGRVVAAGPGTKARRDGGGGLHDHTVSLAVNDDKSDAAARINIAPYKIKLGRYVVQGNAVRFLGNSKQWWAPTAMSSTDNYSNEMTSDSTLKESEFSTGRNRQTIVTGDENMVAASAREATTADYSRHTFDFVGYSPSDKQKRVSASIKLAGSVRTALPTSAVPTLRSKKQWYEESDEPETDPKGTISTRSKPVTIMKDRSQAEVIRNVLTKPLSPTQPAKASPNHVAKKVKNPRLPRQRAGNPKRASNQNKKAKSEEFPKNGYLSLTTEEAELLPFLEALITDGYITLDDVRKSTPTSSTRTSTPASFGSQTTYGVLGTDNKYTSHVHGKKFTRKPIHQTIHKRYRKRLPKVYASSIDKTAVQRKPTLAFDLVPEPYIASFLSKGAKFNKTVLPSTTEVYKYDDLKRSSVTFHAAESTKTPEIALATSATVTSYATESTKKPEIAFATSATVTSYVTEATNTPAVVLTSTASKLDKTPEMKLETTPKISSVFSEKPTVTKFWQTLSDVSRSFRSGIVMRTTGIPRIQKPITLVPNEINSLTMTKIDTQNTSPSYDVIESTNKYAQVDVEKSTNKNVRSFLSQQWNNGLQPSGKPRTTLETKYISIYPPQNQIDDKLPTQNRAIWVKKNKLAKHVVLKKSGIFEVYSGSAEAPARLSPTYNTQVSDSPEKSFTMMSESKRKSQRSKLHSAALTNGQFVNEINEKKSGEGNLKVDDGSKKDGSGIVAATAESVSTPTSSSNVAPTNDTRLHVHDVYTTTAYVTAANSTSQFVVSVLSTPSAVTVVEQEVTKTVNITFSEKPVMIVQEQKLNDSSFIVPTVDTRGTGHTGASLQRYDQNPGANSQSFDKNPGASAQIYDKNESFFRTTGMNEDLSFRASVWTDSTTASPRNITQEGLEVNNLSLEKVKVIEQNEELADFAITARRNSSDLLKGESVSELEKINDPITTQIRSANAGKNRSEKLSESSSTLPHSSTPDYKAGEVTQTPSAAEDGDVNVLLAYEDAMNELLKNGRGDALTSARGPASSSSDVTSRPTQSPGPPVRPAVNVAGSSAKLEGKSKLFSSKRGNGSSRLHSLGLWHLVIFIFVTFLCF